MKGGGELPGHPPTRAPSKRGPLLGVSKKFQKSFNQFHILEMNYKIIEVIYIIKQDIHVLKLGI